MNKEQIQKARDVDFLELLERMSIEYQNESGHVKVLCPFHNDYKTLSMAIYPDNKYYCFGCSESGDVISFVMKVYNIEFADAIQALNEINE